MQGLVPGAGYSTVYIGYGLWGPCTAAMSRSAARHCAASATGAASDSLLWCGGPGLPCRIIIKTIAEGVLGYQVRLTLLPEK